MRRSRRAPRRATGWRCPWRPPGFMIIVAQGDALPAHFRPADAFIPAVESALFAAESHWEGNQLIEIVWLIVTPMTPIGAVGVPAAPLLSAFAEAPAGAPDPLIAPAAPLGSLHGIALLDRLSTLPRGELRSYLDAHPDVVTELLTEPPTAASVSGWWAATPSGDRSSLLGASPQLVGGL